MIFNFSFSLYNNFMTTSQKHLAMYCFIDITVHIISDLGKNISDQILLRVILKSC